MDGWWELVSPPHCVMGGGTIKFFELACFGAVFDSIPGCTRVHQGDIEKVGQLISQQGLWRDVRQMRGC